jgi:hypothetical protein
VSYGGDSPCSTPSAEDNDPVVDPEVLDPKTCGPVVYEPELCGPVSCEPIVSEASGPKISVIVVCYGLT